MSRSLKGKPRCPEGHSCDWCGPKVAADRRDARAPTSAELMCGYCQNPESECHCFHCSSWDPWAEVEYQLWKAEREDGAV